MSHPTQNYGVPFDAFTKGTAEAIALVVAGGVGKVHYIPDIAGASDKSGTELFVDVGTATRFSVTLGSPNAVAFQKTFSSPIVGSSNVSVRVRIGSATTSSWANIGGYTVSYS